ncbi:MAG: hypothetical protein HOP10_06075 [Chitinophagaceae bacterium]|nr:hypothetical protein [Chitinophagaceae bacterium]
MRYAFVFILLMPFFSFAQDSLNCKLNRETDPFTKEVKVSTGFIQLGGASVTIDATKTEIDFLFSIEGADRCYDNNSTAVVFFEGTKVKLNVKNGGSMNCEGLFHFIFKNTNTSPSLLTKLTTMKINHIVFTGNNKKEANIELTSADQQTFMTLAYCLVAGAKTLLK